MRVILDRFCLGRDGDMGTFGKLRLPDGWQCYTVEENWRDNEWGRSCIPYGRYALGLRRSGVVERASEGLFIRGYEVQNVLNRTHIMIHPGNTVRAVDGCIAVGNALGTLDGYWAVMDSDNTFANLMRRFDAAEDLFLEVRSAFQ